MLHATSCGAIVIQPTVDFRDWIRSICNEYRSCAYALYLAHVTHGGSKSPFETRHVTQTGVRTKTSRIRDISNRVFDFHAIARDDRARIVYPRRTSFP